MPLYCEFPDITILAAPGEAAAAAAVLAMELELRTGRRPPVSSEPAGTGARILLRADPDRPAKDSFALTLTGQTLTVTAQNRRGLLYGVGRFLRKTEIRDSAVFLVADITGDYAPAKPIRGHQLGYRGNNNTYDKWTPAQYARYYLDMMYFGTNVCEHVPDEHHNRSPLMAYEPNELLILAAAEADALDLDIGLWYPNDTHQPPDEALAEHERVFRSLPRLDAVFIPGSDPGDLPPDELFSRMTLYSRQLKAAHPRATMWVSAQMPHNAPSWPAEFLRRLQAEPEGLDGVIIGPNHAFGVEELRRACPARYRYRLYPDITHNVRCEYPVHYDRDDWHFALASTLSRESVNPRPQEFQALHRATRSFLSGSVSYSEGVNDDLNKMIWGDLDYFGDGISLRESVLDYARLFFWPLPAETVADGLFLFEQSWIGDPAENPAIGTAWRLWEGLAEDFPSQMDNWRFVLHLFRARCDEVVRRRRRWELELLDEAAPLLRRGETAAAKDLLSQPFPADYQALRGSLFDLARRLYDQIGIQLDVEHFGGESWERGCTLDTIDRPVTDRAWLLGQIAKAEALPPAEGAALLLRSLDRNLVQPDECYFSFAAHGWPPLGPRQEGEFYLNFQGDRPANDGSLPTCLLQVYDHFTFRARLGGFAAGVPYRLRVTWFGTGNAQAADFVFTANGREIYRGKPYGGEADPAFDAEQLGKNYHSASYLLPPEVFENGCLALVFSEPRAGVMLSEFWITKVQANETTASVTAVRPKQK
ncbi:MAG: hypothetical protein LBJ11_06205 [Oscillospiraceae bacterium]|nr:hypothetical protein [Oscillospiraceae bacterium]